MIDCVLARWQPVIGDPTWQGWATVLVYLATMGLALAAVGRIGPGDGRHTRERIFWLVTALGMAALAVNKQLDLQSALTAAGHCLA